MNRRLCGPGIGLIAVALSACGATGTASPDQAADPSANPGGPAGAVGTVAAVSASDMEVQNPRVGQVRVTFSSSTSFTKTVPATIGDLAAGQCAFATGAPRAGSTPAPAGDPAGPLTATSVQISPPNADGACAPGGFGPPRGARGGGPDNGATPSRSPNRPNGVGGGRGGAALGKIVSVSGDSFVVQLGTSNTARSVLTTRTTTFSKIVAADQSSVAVGECVSALGPSDDTGTLSATSISIRQPGSNGCRGGAGRGGQGA